MRIGLAFVLLLLSTAGCDFRMSLAPPGPTARNSPQPSSPAPVAPTTEQQLAEIEELLKARPDDLNLLKTKAIMLQATAESKIQNGDRVNGYADYETSGELWRKIKTATPNLSSQDAAAYGTAIYNLGCALSLKNEVEPAIMALREAVESGFSQMNLIHTDEDLNNLRETASFKTFVEEIPKLRAVSLKRHISSEAIFPLEFALPNFDDKLIKSKDYAGKILIVDVWTTESRSCRQIIPSFVAIDKKYEDKGVEIVGINYERQKDPAARKLLVKGFMKSNGITYECVVGDEHTQQQIPGFAGYPTTLFIDRQGRVRVKFEGAQSRGTLESVVELLLAEPDETVQ